VFLQGANQIFSADLVVLGVLFGNGFKHEFERKQLFFVVEISAVWIIGKDSFDIVFLDRFNHMDQVPLVR
jgi:hypothetical protein